MARPTRIGVACAALAALVLAGCGPKLVRDRVYDNPQVRVELQRREQGGQVIPRGYAHPATIADVRIAHILGSLTFENNDKERKPMIRSEHLYDLAAGIAKALAKATPDDEVAAASFPMDRRLGIFSDDRVTSFRLHIEGDAMRIEFMNVEDPLEKEGSKVSFRDYEIPSDLPTLAPRYTIITSDSISKFGTRGVTVAWRDDTFRRPITMKDREGRVKKRTVLMEMPNENMPPAGAGKQPLAHQDRPPGLSDAQVRALDHADEDRANGSITEPEYQKRRRLILENKLEEAGESPEQENAPQ
ncbi:MAG TPA: hypothetical protein VMR86_19305 [Myxococcota bacterium]|nr:hypothetical protein [Myxococcota bacterium]